MHAMYQRGGWQRELVLKISNMAGDVELALWMAGRVRDAPNSQHQELGYYRCVC